MPLYYFDVSNSGPVRDDLGTECADLAEVRRVAMGLLPDLMRQERPDGDQSAFTLVVRDEEGRPVFAVTLSLIGLDLSEAAF